MAAHDNSHFMTFGSLHLGVESDSLKQSILKPVVLWNKYSTLLICSVLQLYHDNNNNINHGKSSLNSPVVVPLMIDLSSVYAKWGRSKRSKWRERLDLARAFHFRPILTSEPHTRQTTPLNSLRIHYTNYSSIYPVSFYYTYWYPANRIQIVKP